MKKCAMCKKNKRKSSFHKHKGKPGGLQPACKECLRVAFKRFYYSKDQSARNARVTKWRDQRKAENRGKMVEHLKDHPCVDCGEADLIVEPP